MIPIKTSLEINKMRASCKLASQILDALSAMLSPGITTKDVDQAGARLMLESGCKSAFLGYRRFPGNICISINDEVVHGIGGSRRIQYGDIVKLDIGVVLDGFVGDTAATIPVGIISGDVQRLLTVTEEALYKGIEKARDGRRLSELCAAIQDEIEANGFSVVREFVGHGVGRHLHEEPQIPNYRTPAATAKLRAGMTLAIEPMVNMGRAAVKVLRDDWTVVTADHSPSAHFEHTVLVTKGEPEILTWREKTSSKLKAG
ncbi:MAG TPA: type I methionyl aminopeptidase [Chthoniobacterales bacterium]|jgi:methionyl aminopeptidase|nr:type I methionyl aminopeptidase [Chthoniobacterales bacterium]